MSPFIGEFAGTALLIIMGDGVVANVVLNKTKGQNSGWIVITFGWAMAVFLLEHIHIYEHSGEEDLKFIGIYSTHDLVEQAILRMRKLPGFRDAPDGFDITEVDLDEDCWTSGYVTDNRTEADWGPEGIGVGK